MKTTIDDVFALAARMPRHWFWALTSTGLVDPAGHYVPQTDREAAIVKHDALSAHAGDHPVAGDVLAQLRRDIEIHMSGSTRPDAAGRRSCETDHR